MGVEFLPEYKGPERRKECPYPDCKNPEKAAQKAVHQFCKYILGFDPDNADQLKDFQEDLRFGGQMRKFANKGLMTMVIAVAGFLAVAMGTGILTKIKAFFEAVK